MHRLLEHQPPCSWEKLVPDQITKENQSDLHEKVRIGIPNDSYEEYKNKFLKDSGFYQAMEDFMNKRAHQQFVDSTAINTPTSENSHNILQAKLTSIPIKHKETKKNLKKKMEMQKSQ